MPAALRDILGFLLFPLVLIYGLIVVTRNWLYDKRYFKAVQFDFPVINVGNLSVGGTGKTPHIEYLISILGEHFVPGVLSRGYRRKSKGFVLVDSRLATEMTGDEPMQYKRKFPFVNVAVSESRAMGVPELLSKAPNTEVVLLDDAYQHRSVRAGLNILITPYHDRFTKDLILPLGRLREPRSGYKRADIIVVSKCPPNLSIEEAAEIREEIAPLRHQHLYFSCVQYMDLMGFSFLNPGLVLNRQVDVLLLTGIGDAAPLVEYIESKVHRVFHSKYADHHAFDRFDMEKLKEKFIGINSGRKIILTTEKDAMRLEAHRSWIMENQLPVFYQPMRARFLFGEGEKFNKDIFHYINITRGHL